MYLCLPVVAREVGYGSLGYRARPRGGSSGWHLRRSPHWCRVPRRETPSGGWRLRWGPVRVERRQNLSAVGRYVAGVVVRGAHQSISESEVMARS